MKKQILFILLFSIFSYSNYRIEGQIKGGYDVYRTFINHEYNNDEYVKTPQGFRIDLELIPLNINNRLELGIGIGYVGGLDSFFPQYYDNNKRKDLSYTIPIYTLSKLNLVNLENKDSVLYGLLKAGITLNKSFIQNVKMDSGFGFGIGIGTEYRNFVLEVVYDGTLINLQDLSKYTKPNWSIFHRVGVNIGIRFGKEFIDENVKEKLDKKDNLLVFYDVKTQEKAKIQPFEFLEKLPKILILNPDGTIAKSKNGKYLGSNIVTNEQYLYAIEDGNIVLDGDKPKIFTVYINDLDKNVKEINKKIKELDTSKIAVFPSYCDEDKCIINGFNVDSRVPNQYEVEQIKLLVNKINEYVKVGNIEILGHTDSTGSDEYNEELGYLRAKTISNLLINNGLSSKIKIVSIRSNGEQDPIATNSTKLGRYKNRRVEIYINKKNK